MTSTEKAVTEKITAEIATAASTERTALLNDLYNFLGMVEKRINLAKIEEAAQSIIGKVEGEVKAVEQSVVNHVEGILA